MPKCMYTWASMRAQVHNNALTTHTKLKISHFQDYLVNDCFSETPDIEQRIKRIVAFQSGYWL